MLLASGVLRADDATPPATAPGDLTVDQLFGNHAILQQGKPITVWGTGTEGQTVTVDFDGQHAEGVVKDGSWEAHLTPLTAGGPYDLTIQSGTEKIVSSDVSVGDVWLAGGQSNMQCNFGHAPEYLAHPEDYANPQLHSFTVDIVIANSPTVPRKSISYSGWKLVTADQLKWMSMIGCTFATNYQKRMKIPVGLIQSYQGSTPIETWMPLEAVQKVEPDAHPPADEPPLIAGADLSKYFRAYKPIPPGGMYNAMISPLVRFPIKGVLWYQGENNSGHPMNYSQLLTGLISSWREKWGIPDLPFVIDQLSSAGTVLKNDPTKEQLAWLREQQQIAVDATPQTGLTIIYDLGEYGDTHAHAKPPQAKRMLDTYNSFSTGGPKQLGPRYTTSSVNGGQIRVNFETHGHALAATAVVMNKKPGLPAGTDPDAFRTTAGTLSGFTICGADQKFVDATATIDGTSVIVSSPTVTAPVAVRYAWADFALANLFDDTGYPAAPFRTDTFPPPAKLAAPAPLPK